MMDEFVLVVSGSRYATIRDRFIINEVLDRVLEECPGLRLVHGGAQGADSLAGEWAAARGVPVTVFPADWRKHGRAAGPIRNQAMLDAGCDGWAAFPVAGEPNKGTSDFVSRATRSGVHGTVYELPTRT